MQIHIKNDQTLDSWIIWVLRSKMVIRGDVWHLKIIFISLFVFKMHDFLLHLDSLFQPNKTELSAMPRVFILFNFFIPSFRLALNAECVCGFCCLHPTNDRNAFHFYKRLANCCHPIHISNRRQYKLQFHICKFVVHCTH